MSQGLVRWCPQGFYRANYTAFDAAVSQTCLACQPGITTEGAGARLATDCSRVMPGYGVSTLNATASSPGQLPTLPMDANTGLPQANLCAIGTYSLGGFCVTCPSGTVTRQMGAIAVEECGESWSCGTLGPFGGRGGLSAELPAIVPAVSLESEC
jgi:hypothetical protein